MKYTSSQIKAIGGKRFFKRNQKRIIILSLASLLWIPAAIYFVRGNSVFNEYALHIKLFIYAAAPLLVGVNILFSYKQACKLFYEKVRKNPELLQ